MGLGRVLILALIVSSTSLAAADAESTSPGEVVVTASAQVAPAKLPRTHRAPGALTVGFTSRSAVGGPTPGLSHIHFDISPRVGFDPAGLPGCPISELYESYGSAPVCRGSLVGDGTADSEIALQGQAPVTEEGQLQAFFSRDRGRPTILAQVKTDAPEPLVYVIPFYLWKPESARGGYRIVAYKMRRIIGKCMGRCPGPGPYSLEGVYTQISRFSMSLHRLWSKAGSRHSFVDARCPAKEGSRSDYLLMHLRLGYEGGYPSQGVAVRQSCAGS